MASEERKRNNFIIWFTVKELISIWFFWMWMLGRGGGDRKTPDTVSQHAVSHSICCYQKATDTWNACMAHSRLQTGLKRVTLSLESCLGLSGASPAAAERDWRARSRHLLSQKLSFSLQFQSTFCQRPALAATGFTNVNLACQAPVERLSPPIRPKISVDYIINPSWIKKKEVRQQEDWGKEKKELDTVYTTALRGGCQQSLYQKWMAASH